VRQLVGHTRARRLRRAWRELVARRRGRLGSPSVLRDPSVTTVPHAGVAPGVADLLAVDGARFPRDLQLDHADAAPQSVPRLQRRHAAYSAAADAHDLVSDAELSGLGRLAVGIHLGDHVEWPGRLASLNGDTEARRVAHCELHRPQLAAREGLLVAGRLGRLGSLLGGREGCLAGVDVRRCFLRCISGCVGFYGLGGTRSLRTVVSQMAGCRLGWRPDLPGGRAILTRGRRVLQEVQHARTGALSIPGFLVLQETLAQLAHLEQTRVVLRARRVKLPLAQVEVRFGITDRVSNDVGNVASYESGVKIAAVRHLELRQVVVKPGGDRGRSSH